MHQDLRATTTLSWGLVIIVGLRIVFPRLFSILDDDTLVLFMDAKRQIMTGVWSKVSTLQVALIRGLWWLLENKPYAARWASVLAGLGTMLLLVLAGWRDGDYRGGLLAAMFFGIVPLSVFYSTLALPYAMLTFLGVLGVFLLSLANTGRGAWLGILAGAAWGGAFLCKTFAAVLAVPAGLALFLALRPTRRRPGAWLPPLAAIATWAIIVGTAMWWRGAEYGLNDYIVDWRFRLATPIWSSRWVGLVNLQALYVPVLAPGLVLALRRRQDVFGRLGYATILAVLAVYLLNPVNHFPRVLLPLAPFLAYYAGRELSREMTILRHGTLLAWVILALAPPLLLWLKPAWALDGRPWLPLAETALGLGLFFVLRAMSPSFSDEWLERVTGLLVLACLLGGFAAGFQDLNRVELAYAARCEAVQATRVGSGIIGGGDIIHFITDQDPKARLPEGVTFDAVCEAIGEQEELDVDVSGLNNFSRLTDLPKACLEKIPRLGLARIMQALQTPVAIEDLADSEGTLAMLGLPDNPFRALDRQPDASRVFDNGRFAAYRLDSVINLLTAKPLHWENVAAEWDRSITGLPHATPARLQVRRRPMASDKDLFANPHLEVEFTDRPGGEETYRLEVVARDTRGGALWRYAEPLETKHGIQELGVQTNEFIIDRQSGARDGTIGIPETIAGIASIEVHVIPEGGGQPLWVMVHVPDWW